MKLCSGRTGWNWWCIPWWTLLAASQNLIPCYAKFTNYLANDIVQSVLSFHLRKNFIYVTPRLWVDTIVVSELRTRFHSVVTICQPFTKMLTSSQNHVIGANEMEDFEEARAPIKSFYGDWVIWCMGRWFYGPVVSSHEINNILGKKRVSPRSWKEYLLQIWHT